MLWTVIGLVFALPTWAFAQPNDHVPRTRWGTPDLSGYWAYGTATPLERPEALAGGCQVI